MKISGHHSAEDVFKADLELIALYQTTPFQKIHLIFDFTETQSIPPISTIIRVKIGRQINLGWVIIFGSLHPLVRIITATSLRIFNLPFRLVASRAEALQFLTMSDSTLPPLENIGDN
jgi:hypothetical protein